MSSLKALAIAFGCALFLSLGFINPFIRMTWLEVISITLVCAAYIVLTIYLVWTGFSRTQKPMFRALRLSAGIYLILSPIISLLWLPFFILGILIGIPQLALTPFYFPYLGYMSVAYQENSQHYRQGVVTAFEVLYEVKIGDRKYSRVHQVYCAERSGVKMFSFKNDFKSHIYRNKIIAISAPLVIKTENNEILTADNGNQLCQHVWPKRRLERGFDPYKLYYLTRFIRKPHIIELQIKGEASRAGRVTVYKPTILARSEVPARDAIKLGDLKPFTSKVEEGLQMPPLVSEFNSNKK